MLLAWYQLYLLHLNHPHGLCCLVLLPLEVSLKITLFRILQIFFVCVLQQVSVFTTAGILFLAPQNTTFLYSICYNFPKTSKNHPVGFSSV